MASAIGSVVKSVFAFSAADTVVNCIKKALDRVDESINSALQGANQMGLMQQLEAGKQVRLAIENMSKVYEKSFTLTLEKTDAVVQRHFGEAERMINDLKDVFLVNTLFQRAECLIRDLPFIDNTPYVTHMRPGGVVASREDYGVLFELSGSFPMGGKEEPIQRAGGRPTPKPEIGKPTLFIQKNQYSPLRTLAASVIFSVPFSVLFPNQGDSNKISLATFHVEVPFLEKNTGKIKTHQYTGFVGMLPISIGRVAIEYSVKGVDRVYRNFESIIFSQNSRPYAEDKTITGRQYSISPNDGYKIEKKTAKINWHEKKGKSFGAPISEEEDRAVFAVSTHLHKKYHKIGKVRFALSCTGYKDVEAIKKEVKTLDLKWGDNIALESVGDARVVLTTFDGASIEITGLHSHPYVKLMTEGGKRVVRVADARSVNMMLVNPQAILPNSKL